MDCLRDEGMNLSLFRCFTGWSRSLLVGAVVMIFGAVIDKGGEQSVPLVHMSLIFPWAIDPTYAAGKAPEELPPGPWRSF